MNCEEAIKKIPEFLNDTLEESARLDLRDHLWICSKCELALEGVPAVGTDLRKLGNLNLPFKLPDALYGKSGPSTIASQGKALWRAYQSGVSFEFKIALMAALIFSMILVIWLSLLHYKTEQEKPLYIKLRSVKRSQSAANPSVTRLAPSLSEGSQRTVILDATELTPDDIQNVSSSSAGGRSQPLSYDSNQNVIVLGWPDTRTHHQDHSSQVNPRANAMQEINSIRPIHLHLQFPTDNAKSLFLSEVKSLASETLSLYSDFIVISFSRENLKKLVDQTAKISGLEAIQKDLDVTQMPKFKKPVIISFFLTSSQESYNPEEFLDWHLKFYLANAFTFKKDLKQSGFQFLYEDEELWLLELTPDQFKELIQKKAQFQGLVVTTGNRALPESNQFPDTIKIALYLLP